MRCPNAFAMAAVNHTLGMGGFFRKPCGSFHCRVCRPGRIAREERRIGEKLAAHDGEVYYFECAASDWKRRIAPYIRAEKGSAFRVLMDTEGLCACVATVRPASGGVRMSASKGAARLAACLEDMDCFSPGLKGKRRLDASGAWRQAPLPGSSSPGDDGEVVLDDGEVVAASRAEDVRREKGRGKWERVGRSLHGFTIDAYREYMESVRPLVRQIRDGKGLRGVLFDLRGEKMEAVVTGALAYLRTADGTLSDSAYFPLAESEDFIPCRVASFVGRNPEYSGSKS